MSRPAYEGFGNGNTAWLAGWSTSAGEWELEMLRADVLTEMDYRTPTDGSLVGAPIKFSYFRSENGNELAHMLLGAARIEDIGLCRYMIFNGERADSAGTSLRCYEAMIIGEMAVVQGSSAVKPAETDWTPDLLGESSLLVLRSDEVSIRRDRRHPSLQAWFAIRQPMVQAYQPAFFGLLADLLQEVPAEARQNVRI